MLEKDPESFRFRIWTIAPLCFTWTLWKERNRQTFEGKELPVERVKSCLPDLYFYWMSLDVSRPRSVDILDSNVCDLEEIVEHTASPLQLSP